MYEMNLEPWEKIPENFEKTKSLIQSICYPLMKETPEMGTTYRIYPEGCISGNGTSYHGAVRLGKDSKKLLIFLNGGGVSYDEYTVSRPSNLFTGHIQDTYYSNDGEWIGDYFLRTGMGAAREDNPFLDWSMIHLLYCNGDFHCGNGDFPYTALDGSKRMMPFHGFKNVMSVIKMAKKYISEPLQIVIAGSSAGGFGVSLLADDIIQEFPSCSDITCVVDSSLLFSAKWQLIARDIWHSPDHIWKRLKSDNIVLDSLSELYKKYGNQVRYMYMCSVRDALLVKAQNALDGNGLTTDIESGIKFQSKLKAMCSLLVQNIPEIGLYIFTGPMDAPGYDEDLLTLHCALNNSFLFDHKEEGISPCDWILNAIQDKVDKVGTSHLFV